MATDYHIGQSRNGTCLFLQKLLLAKSSEKKIYAYAFSIKNQLNGEVEVDFSVS